MKIGAEKLYPRIVVLLDSLVRYVYEEVMTYLMEMFTFDIPVSIRGLNPTRGNISRLFLYEYSPPTPYRIQEYAVLLR